MPLFDGCSAAEKILPSVDGSGLRVSFDAAFDDRFFFATSTFLPDILRPADRFGRAVIFVFRVAFFFFAITTMYHSHRKATTGSTLLAFRDGT